QDNKPIPLEINVIDFNDVDGTAVHESSVASLLPITVVIPAGAANRVKSAKPSAGNADIEAVPHAVTLSTADGTCPAGTMGAVDFGTSASGSPNTTAVQSASEHRGAVNLTANAAAFTSTNKKSPRPCTATVTATVPMRDRESSNNVTKQVIDVIDKNDF